MTGVPRERSSRLPFASAERTRELFGGKISGEENIIKQIRVIPIPMDIPIIAANDLQNVRTAETIIDSLEYCIYLRDNI